MDRNLQNKALFEILSTADIIIAAKNKAAADKVADELGVALHSMGIRPSEARALFEIASEVLLDNDDDDEIILMGLSNSVAEDN